MLSLILLFFMANMLAADVLADCVCVYAGQPYSCGAFNGGQICCQGTWHICNWCSNSNCWQCPVCGPPCLCAPENITQGIF